MPNRAIFLVTALFALCLLSAAELQNVQVNGATYCGVEETNPHIGVLRGMIFEPSGEPAAGATIKLQEEATLVSDSGPAQQGQHRQRIFHVPKGRSLLRIEGKTTAKGEIAFDALPLSPFTIDAYSESGRYHGQFVFSADHPQLTLNTTFEPAVTIRGHVMDSAGNPASGASISASAEFRLAVPGTGGWSGYAKSTEDGSFEIRGAPIIPYTFLASFDNLVGQYQRGVKVDEGPIELVAMHAGSVRGAVVDDATGFPMYGVQVSVQNVLSNINQNTTMVETDDDGRFEVSNIYPGDCVVYAQFPSDKPHVWIMATRGSVMTVQEDATTDVTIKMIRGATIVGRVVDADTGEVISGASVSARVPGYEEVRAFKEEGSTYRIIGVHAGEVEIRYNSAFNYPEGDQNTKISLTANYGQVVTAPDIHISRGLTASGHVVDIDGKGIPGFEVSCEITGEASHRYQHAISGPEGVFQIYGLRHESKIRLYGGLHRGGDAVDDLVSDVLGPLVVGPDGLSEISITAYAPGTISGTLLDDEKKPLSNIWVRAQYSDAPNYPFSGPDARTDDAGRFTVKHLATGHYSLEVYGDGPSRAVSLPSITIARSEYVKDLVITDPGPEQRR